MSDQPHRQMIMERRPDGRDQAGCARGGMTSCAIRLEQVFAGATTLREINK